jgi:hypothetical protein
MKRKVVLAGIVLAAMLVGGTALMPTSFALALDPGDPSGDGVIPDLVTGNPDCADIGFGYGFKIGGAPNGTFPFDKSNGGELTGGAPSDPYNSVTISNSDGYFFDWLATLGIDAVIVKGGPNADAFVYVPEDTADTELHAPINPTNGQYYSISHIEFCYDYELTASKTANTEYTRTYTWEITKSVDPDEHTGWFGDEFSSDYEVFVDRTVTDSAWAVSGAITINNPTPFTVGFSVADSVGGTAATVNCPSYELAPGGSVTCTYSASLTGAVNGTNTATITSLNAYVGGATAVKDYTFGDPTTVVGYPTINVTDYFDGDLVGDPLGSASGNHTFYFSREFACPTDETMYTDGVYTDSFPNVAEIDETDQYDDANVDLTCYMPLVSKDAHTTYTRTYSWTIDKVGDQTALTLSIGQQFLVNYEVEVDATYIDSDWAAYGSIYVTNPSDEAITVDVSDAVNGTAATVDCDGFGGTSLTVAAGDIESCEYSVDLPDGTNLTNTATVEFNGYDFTADADVIFGEPTTEVDECIDVSDDQYGVLGTVCVGVDTLPKTFTYSLYVGPYDVCGYYEFVNIASFITNDNGVTGSDSWTVAVDVPCGGGCTLTPGYWKTHSKYGPAPYDDNWANLGDEDLDELFEHEDEDFFKAKKNSDYWTWYESLWKEPKGNPYWILAHAYIAARLNILNGASTTPEVDAALVWATNFFMNKRPSDDFTKAQKRDITYYAGILDQYNNGYIGPGHCSE